MAHTKGNWKVGKRGGTVVSNEVPLNYLKETGHDDINYYGGFLIGESIRDCDLKLIAAAPDLLEALIEIDKELAGRFHRDYDKSLDLMSNDLKEIVTKIREVIKKATE